MPLLLLLLLLLLPMFAAARRNITLTKAEKAKIQLGYRGIAEAMLQDAQYYYNHAHVAIEEIIVLIKPVVTAAELSVGREGGCIQPPVNPGPIVGHRPP